MLFRSLVLLALTLVYLATGYGYTPESRAFPVTVGWAALALAIVDIVSRTQTAIGYAILQRLNPAALPEKADSHPHYPVPKQIQAVVWALGFVTLILLIGILYAVPAYVFSSLLVRGKRPLLTCLVFAAAATLFIYLLFVQVLMIELYPGMLFADY